MERKRKPFLHKSERTTTLNPQKNDVEWVNAIVESQLLMNQLMRLIRDSTNPNHTQIVCHCLAIKENLIYIENHFVHEHYGQERVRLGLVPKQSPS